MNVYLRNGAITLIINAIIFVIGWGCIVPDTINDQTHLFGLVGNVEILKGNTSTVFAVCSIMSTLIMIAGLVEALVEDYSRPRFNMNTRVEKPRKTKISGMRVEPTPEKVDEDKDPKTPTMD